MYRHSKGTLGGHHTAVVHAGTPSHDFQGEWAKTTVYFHGFADLPAERGKGVWSPKFKCLGYIWAIHLYPGGDNVEDENVDVTTDTISIYLESRHSENIKVVYQLAIGNYNISQTDTFNRNSSWGFVNFIDRNRALNNLVHGALAIQVRMKPANSPPPFIPDNPSTYDTIQSLFMEKESADIVFHVGGERKDTDPIDSGAKALDTKEFHAHRLILKKAAPLLAELSMCDKSPSHVEIPNVSPAAFKALLLYVYGRRIPKFGVDISLTKEIIDAADKYGITHLKLEAEAVYVASIEITCENVLENLQYADSKNCALLREAVMNFIEGNAAELLEMGTLKDAPEGMFQDILAVVARKKKRKKTENEISIMRISELRRAAAVNGLDVDGSREMLIASIKAAKNDDEDDGED